MIRGIWDRDMAAIMQAFALLPLALIWARFEGGAGLSQAFFILLILAGWQFLFMLIRAQPPSLSILVTALAVAMLAPQDLGVVRLFLGVSFGIVMGELVFGGWGRNVLNPATVTLAFLGFGFPAFAWPDLLLPVAWAAIPAVLIGSFTGIFALPMIISATAIAGLGVWLGLLDTPMLITGAVVLVVLVADPVASANTKLGSWLYGAVFGGLLLLFDTAWATAAPVQAAVAAALLASIAAPLLDETAIALWVARRRKRHGRD